MKKVLIVNDSKFESMVIQDIVKDMGYEVKATDEYEAMGHVLEFSPDIVIANLIMKETTGDHLIERIKKRNNTILCVLSSSNPIRLEDYKSKKVDQVLHTPVKRKELEDVLDPYHKGEMLQDKNNLKNIEKFMKKMAFCPYCGEKFNKEMNKFHFCPYCGEKL